MTDLRGIFCALTTPFDDDGALDDALLRDLIDRMIAHGVHGLVSCGSTGEFTVLTLTERKHVTELVVEQAAGRVPVIAQVGAMRTATALELARHAASVGADAVLAVQAWYEPLSLSEVFAYFADISTAVSIPIGVYNLPDGTGVNLEPRLLAQMAREIDGVAFVKDTSGDFAQVTELVYEYSDVIGTFVGDDRIVFPGLALGCVGSIWGAPNLMPAQCVDLFDYCAAGDLAAARELWSRIWPVQNFLFAEGYAACVKAGTDMAGIPVGEPRRPLQPLDPARQATLRTLMEAAGVFEEVAT